MSKRISFTKVRKTDTDKLLDLINKETKVVLVKRKVKTKYKTGKNKGKIYTKVVSKYERKGISKLAKKLRISPNKLKGFAKHGVPKNSGKSISNVWKKGMYSDSKIQTIEFKNDSLTKQNWFKPKKIRRLYKHEQYYFRCGIYLECVSNTNKNATYIIPNLPIPTTPPPIQSSNYLEGFWEVFEELKRTLQAHPSIKLWRVNYFDVNIIDLKTRSFVSGKTSKVSYGGTNVKRTKKGKKKQVLSKQIKALKKKYGSKL